VKFSVVAIIICAIIVLLNTNTIILNSDNKKNGVSKLFSLKRCKEKKENEKLEGSEWSELTHRRVWLLDCSEIWAPKAILGFNFFLFFLSQSIRVFIFFKISFSIKSRFIKIHSHQKQKRRFEKCLGRGRGETKTVLPMPTLKATRRPKRPSRKIPTMNPTLLSSARFISLLY